MKSLLRRPWAASCGRRVLEALFKTVRYEVDGAEHYQDRWRAGEPVIFVLWHGRLLPLAYLHRDQGIVALVSRSRDGEQIAHLMEGWGFGVVRGSSSRGGGPALRELVRRVREGRSLAITPDGPRGPRQRMKPGPLVAAQLTGRALVPVAAGADRAWWPGTWDRFLVPRPYARVRVCYGAPREVPRKLGAGALEERAREVEQTLNELVRRVDRDGAGR